MTRVTDGPGLSAEGAIMTRALSYRAGALVVPLLMAATAGPVAAAAAPGTASAPTAARAGTTQAGAAAGPVVFTWGDNSAGELGNGTLTGSAAPAAVSGPEGCVLQLGRRRKRERRLGGG